MKNIKRVLSIVMMLAMLVPLAVVGSYADDSVLENWNTFAAKFSSSTDKIIAPNGVIKTEGFGFTVTEDNGIHVSVPDTTTFKGAYPVAGVSSKYPTPLADLNVKITIDSAFAPDGAGYYSNYSMIWSEREVTALSDETLDTGLVYGGAAMSNGLRHILSETDFGLCVMVGNSFPKYMDTKTASTVYLVLYDGSFVDGSDNRPGYRWSFLARNHPDTAIGDDTGICQGYENIDLSNGLEWNVREDSTVGYVVSVNGKEYYRGYEVGYFPNNNGGLTMEDVVDNTDKYLNSMTYARKDIDLSVLTDVVEGYVTVGSVGNNRAESTSNFTLDTINHQPAATWTGHYHTWGEDTVKVDATCTEAGSVARTCTVCGYSETRTLPASHNYDTERYDNVKSTCLEQGYYKRNCLACGEVGTFYLQLDWHEYNDTEHDVIIQQPTYTQMGISARYCSKGCGYALTSFLPVLPNPFEDVKEGKWYTTPILYCFENGYMAGVSETVFGYKNTVTREMFATILAKIDGADLAEYEGKSSFTDIKTTGWYTAAIEWAYQNGYAAGLGEGIFGYKANVSREQLAMFFYTYSEKNGVDVSAKKDISGYEDYSRIHAYAVDAVAWAVEAGLIEGTSETTLAPRDSATRSEIAVIVNNFVEKVLAPSTETPEEPETPVDPETPAE
ncbi:MAG: S-layer homology domain-containing protein [Clostridia bacterium]|nr:S-layer homology domain-containing protein [Clostridia bacterium]